MGVGVFARLQHTPGIRQWDPRAENWVLTCASIWDQNPETGSPPARAGGVGVARRICPGPIGLSPQSSVRR